MPFGVGPISGMVFKYASGFLFFVVLVLGARLALEVRSNGKKQDQIEKLSLEKNNLQTQLDNISSAKRNQEKTTTRTIERVVKGDPQVRVVTKTIREAPIEKECKTPALETLKAVL